MAYKLSEGPGAGMLAASAILQGGQYGTLTESE